MWKRGKKNLEKMLRMNLIEYDESSESETAVTEKL